MRYFAYGSNLDAEQMRDRCPTSRGLFRARLDGYRLDFTHLSLRWGGGAADVVPQVGECVWGVLYELASQDLTRLDRFEPGYERVLVSVRDDESSAHQALTYVVREKQILRPTQVYLEKMMRWGQHWRLPEEYLSHLSSFPTLEETG